MLDFFCSNICNFFKKLPISFCSCYYLVVLLRCNIWLFFFSLRALSFVKCTYKGWWTSSFSRWHFPLYAIYGECIRVVECRRCICSSCCSHRRHLHVITMTLLYITPPSSYVVFSILCLHMSWMLSSRFLWNAYVIIMYIYVIKVNSKDQKLPSCSIIIYTLLL